MWKIESYTINENIISTPPRQTCLYIILGGVNRLIWKKPCYKNWLDRQKPAVGKIAISIEVMDAYMNHRRLTKDFNINVYHLKLDK